LKPMLSTHQGEPRQGAEKLPRSDPLNLIQFILA
jgi:hypothetical protein